MRVYIIFSISYETKGGRSRRRGANELQRNIIRRIEAFSRTSANSIWAQKAHKSYPDKMADEEWKNGLVKCFVSSLFEAFVYA